MSDIRENELELRRLQLRISRLSESNEKEELLKKSVQLDYNQETAFMNLLERTDKAYDSLVQENFDLLITDRIEFNVARGGANAFKSHATKFNGEIQDDGLFHCGTAEMEATLINYYPLSYVGLFNYFGEADIYIDRKRYNLFSNKVPKKFIGVVNAKGGLFLEATESFEESHERIYVNTITADLFSGHSEKRDKFIANRANLKVMISDYRKNIS
jgi:hypothetical protein